jgi:hypothetical protein
MTLRPRNREKRCYELSWRYLVHDERYNDGTWSLVQGEVTSAISGVPHGHAWLISDHGRIYDPVHNKEYACKDYAADFDAIPLMTYSLQEALHLGAHHGHYGPWIEPPSGR